MVVKEKALPEEKSDDELPAGIVDDYPLYPLVVYSNLKCLMCLAVMVM